MTIAGQKELSESVELSIFCHRTYTSIEGIHLKYNYNHYDFARIHLWLKFEWNVVSPFLVVSVSISLFLSLIFGLNFSFCPVNKANLQSVGVVWVLWTVHACPLHTHTHIYTNAMHVKQSTQNTTIELTETLYNYRRRNLMRFVAYVHTHTYRHTVQICRCSDAFDIDVLCAFPVSEIGDVANKNSMLRSLCSIL